MTSLPCREAARLMSAAVEQPLGWHERLELQVHLTLCRACRHYQQQIVALDHFFRTQAGRPTPGTASLSPEARERLKRSLIGPN